jgi:hypothetical protein
MNGDADLTHQQLHSARAVPCSARAVPCSWTARIQTARRSNARSLSEEAILLRQTIYRHLRRSWPDKILNYSSEYAPGFFEPAPSHLPASPYPPQRRITRINSLLAQDFLVMRHWMDHGTCSTAPVDQGKTTVYHDFSRRSHGAHAALGGRQIQRVDHCGYRADTGGRIQAATTQRTR